MSHYNYFGSITEKLECSQTSSLLGLSNYTKFASEKLFRASNFVQKFGKKNKFLQIFAKPAFGWNNLRCLNGPAGCISRTVKFFVIRHWIQTIVYSRTLKINPKSDRKSKNSSKISKNRNFALEKQKFY